MSTQPESKHTPGPWIAEETGFKGSAQHNIWNKSRHLLIAEVWNMDTDKRSYANAALIASAPTLLSRNAELEAENNKLQAFKDYVHKRLDDAGIEKNPEGEHSKNGCRIGDRLSIVLAKNKRLREALGTLIDPVSGDFWGEYKKVLHASDRKKILQALKH